MTNLDLATLLATVTVNNPLPWRLVDRTESGKDTDADRDVLDANGRVVTWVDGRSAPAALMVAAVNALAVPVPSLADATVGAVVRTADDAALPGGGGTAEQARDLAGREFVRVQDGGRTDWVSCDPDRAVITFWATSDLLFALGAVFLSVPREVGHA